MGGRALEGESGGRHWTRCWNDGPCRAFFEVAMLLIVVAAWDGGFAYLLDAWWRLRGGINRRWPRDGWMVSSVISWLSS